MLNTLAISLIFINIYCLKKLAINNGNIEIGFFLFFSAGYIYYFATPLLFLANIGNIDSPELEIIKPYIEKISINGMSIFGILSIIYYAVFSIGYSIFSRKSRPQVSEFNNSVSRKTLSIIFLAVILLTVLTALPIRGDFFKGYSPELFDNYKDGVVVGADSRGTYVAAVCMLFVVALMLASHTNAKLNAHQSIKSILIRPEIIIYMAFSLMMVSLGGRLYLISHAIALATFSYSTENKKVSIKKLTFTAFIAVVIAGFYGVIRASESVSFDKILLNIAQEPFYTAISLYSFINGNYWTSFNFPLPLASDFSNLLPSAFFPEKSSYILKPESLGYDIAMPLGGFHFFATLMINFGYVGSIFTMLAFGMIIGALKRKTNQWFYRIIYSLLTGWCTFSLFRDPASVVIVKNIFQYSLIFPFLVFTAAKIRFI